LDFSLRELEFFDHLRKCYLNSRLDSRSYAALDEWTAFRIHQVVIRSIYYGNKRFAARIVCNHWGVMTGWQRCVGMVRLFIPNALVRLIKHFRSDIK
jgi:hypothetical protein